MTEEVSMDALARMVRRVIREELERDEKRVILSVLKVVADTGAVKEKKPHEKRVMVAE